MTPDDEEQLQRALELAYAHLNRRDRTVSEVRAHLEHKGVVPHRGEAAIAELCDRGVLDDERFARLFVSDKRELEQWGAERIRRGLLARGIDRDRADAALERSASTGDGDGDGDGDGVGAVPGEAAVGAETELDRALALLRRRFPQPPEDRRDRERALGVLLRKGYESELALDALAAHARGD